ncbi:hypothetical protein O163_08205 [Caldanaerobacter subterraneus subsp. yonseiensis KB-1]|uniref:Uncharacterized protein n=1 Tax=Caldanaerobacter subterraneus subsp. yonseiensis KB-1 TaxID=1388761 RepID=U5CG85_CALSX|nr:hypothetical protein [Caldanaerobacter subterraneus]ERM91920.1 hypothetical protein O163_08205 [Caldanaerobacter subterraneus subsp. yonseiensis KB-1]
MLSKRAQEIINIAQQYENLDALSVYDKFLLKQLMIQLKEELNQIMPFIDYWAEMEIDDEEIKNGIQSFL